MVYRVYVEKKENYRNEANGLLLDIRNFLNIQGVKEVRIINRYDVEGLEEEYFELAKSTIFSEPPVDDLRDKEDLVGDYVFAVEALPGQFDQRADSAAQCLQLLSQKEKPLVDYAKVYLLNGELSKEELEKIKTYVINPVEAREASLDEKETLKKQYDQPKPIVVLDGFISKNEEELKEMINQYGLAMDYGDICHLQNYFRDEEKRDPTMTELRVVDTYWSDHCRHTTFSTHIDEVEIKDEEVKKSYERYLSLRDELFGKDTTRPITLMDVATIGAKALKKKGYLKELDESEEINACSIEVEANVNDKKEPWLVMFKNETHNHPTEIEPFGGAATCIGGCIRDPLSGRVYVHQAMRVTGSGDPRTPLEETLEGKLPQRKITQTAQSGYSSYGNQIGLATGGVFEVYDEGYVAKRLECGAVVGAAKKENVVRERPQEGDVIVLLGGRTGRDGIGGATGSSKSHNLSSLETMASEVQKGNAPEERKIQRLFKNEKVARMIKRCNDFGAGGVSVAIGELADGLDINLDAVRKKYEGLDGTEIAISESQERMAVVLAKEDEDAFIEEARKENLEAYRVAVVTNKNRMVMDWNGQRIVDISRDFLNTNGAIKHSSVVVEEKEKETLYENEYHSLMDMAKDIHCATSKGFVERFDSTVGAMNLLMPFGGYTQRSQTQAMASLLPCGVDEKTTTGTIMSWGYDPEITKKNPYKGSYDAVHLSIAKLVASGGDYRKAYLSFQEFFEKLGEKPTRWGKPFGALLGGLDAQMELKVGAIGGKDSMSGSFLDKDVPPTLISFAICPMEADDVISTDFKDANHAVVLLDEDDRLKNYETFMRLAKEGKVKSAYAVDHCVAEAIMKMSFGNEIGFQSNQDIDWYSKRPGAILVELVDEEGLNPIGYTTTDKKIVLGEESESIENLWEVNHKVLEDVFPYEFKGEGEVHNVEYDSKERMYSPIKKDTPRALIPVFPGTNCEYDTARALYQAGAEPKIIVLKNLSSEAIDESVKEFAEELKKSDILVIPGGFSGGDEPEGSAKMIAAFFRTPLIKQEVENLLEERKGLVLGICNGAQALIKLGLVPYGKIVEPDENYPTLTFNTIGRHQSKIVRTRIASNKSPWLSEVKVGDVYCVPISHGEGRFLANEELLKELEKNGQIATQYVDYDGNATMHYEDNPNGSVWAIEGITSLDGRVFAKMGHSERVGKDLYQNVEGDYDMKVFQSAVKYFQGE